MSRKKSFPGVKEGWGDGVQCGVYKDRVEVIVTDERKSVEPGVPLGRRLGYRPDGGADGHSPQRLRLPLARRGDTGQEWLWTEKDVPRTNDRTERITGR